MRVLIYLIIVTLSEATIGVFAKLAGGSIPLFTLNFYRLFFASLFLLVMFLFFRKEKLKFPKNNLRDIFVIGLLITLQISLYNAAMIMGPIANAVVFWSIAPFFVFIFSSIFLGEKPKKIYILIFILAIMGIIIARPLSGGNAFSNCLALITGIVYAILVTFLRKEGIDKQSNDIVWSMITGAIILLPALFIFGPGEIFEIAQYGIARLYLPSIFWAIALGVIATGLAFYFISVVLRDIDANIYSLFDIIFSPIVAGLLGYWIFNEIPSIHLVYGGALLIIAGVWISYEMTKETPKSKKEIIKKKKEKK